MHRYLIAVMLSIVVLLGICGCGKKQNETTEATADAVVVTDPTEVVASEPISGVVASSVDDGDLDENGDVVAEDAYVIATAPQESKPAETKEPTSAIEEPEKNTTPTAATEPAETTLPTVPQETTPVITPGVTQELTEYEKYNAMSGEEQMAYMQSFDSIEAFFTWYNNAKAEYEAAHPDIEISDGVIDAGDLMG